MKAICRFYEKENPKQTWEQLLAVLLTYFPSIL